MAPKYTSASSGSHRDDRAVSQARSPVRPGANIRVIRTQARSMFGISRSMPVPLIGRGPRGRMNPRTGLHELEGALLYSYCQFRRGLSHTE